MIRSILVQVTPQSEGSPGQVTEGFYTMDGEYLQMTFRDGRPLDNPLYRVRLAEGIKPEEVAANLTKTIRREMSGEVVPGFNRVMSYPKAVVA